MKSDLSFKLLLSFPLLIALASISRAQLTPPSMPEAASNAARDDATEEDEQERLVAERFQELLIKRPRPGTALDKVYEFHVQRGSLNKYCDDLRSDAEKNGHGESYLLLGLVLLQRGQESEAVACLQKAEELLPEEAMASYHYGKSLALIGNADLALAALNRAVQRKPSKSDALLVLQDLGRLYQRMGRSQEATEVWKNLETSFPDDARVKEQIAAILAEEGATAEALKRYEALIETTKDRYRKIELSLQAAQLKETLGRREDALADFERLLGQVNPDSWIHQDLRSRIDRAFTSRNDYDGLAKYYQRWVETHPDDVDAMLRVGRFLLIQRRTPEAKEWLVKAKERAPSNPAPRLALVDALEREKQFAEATKELRGVAALEPDNADHIVRLGKLTFADQAVPEKERARSAADIWKTLLESRGEDAVTVSRVGDLLGSVNLVDEAVAAFRKAIELADDQPQYREYLGEYLFRQDRKDEALAVWRELASGPRETRDNLVRLSEVLTSFRLDEEALATMTRACADHPTFDQRIAYTKMLCRAKRFDEAIAQIELASAMAESANEQSMVLEQQVETYQASGQLQAKITELEKAVASGDKDNWSSWQKLALFLEADRRFFPATTAIGKAVELSPQSPVLLTVQARILEKAGLNVEAIGALRKLAELDRRLRSDYLMQIATLQLRVGQTQAAKETGKELVTGAANSEQLKFFADLCFRTGEDALGLETLRRNLRRNPNDRDAVHSLAGKLALSGQDSEAIELFWRAFAAATSTDERRNDVLALTQLYKPKDKMQSLLDRLSGVGQERGDPREVTLLMATAKQAAGDLPGARTLLESLVTEDSRDVEVLNSLIQFAVTEGDWESAVRNQRRLNVTAPSTEGEMRLAKFLVAKGEIDEPLAIWANQSRGGNSTERVVQIVDLLFKNRQKERAIEYVQKVTDRAPDDWELHATLMCCLWHNREFERAVALAERVTKFPLAFDSPSAQYQKRLAQGAANAASASAASANGSAPQQADLASRIQLLERFTNSLSALLNPATVASFDSYGDAKLTAKFLMQYGAEFARRFSDPQMNALRTRVTPSKPAEVSTLESSEEIWELIAMQHCALPYLGTVAEDKFPLDALLNRLIELGDPEAKALLLESRFLGRTARRQSQISPLSQPNRQNNWLLLSGLMQRTQRPQRVAFDANGRVQAEAEPESRSNEELDRLRDYFGQKIAKTKTVEEQIAYLLWFAEEYRLAKREDEVAMFVAKAKELVEENAPKEQFLGFLPFDRQYALKRFGNSFSQKSTTPTARPIVPGARVMVGYSANYSVSWLISSVFEHADAPEELASLCSAIKESQVAAARMLTPSQLTAYRPDASMTLNIYAANTARASVDTTQISVMSESAILSTDMVTAFYFIHLRGSTEVKAAVAKRLAEEAEGPDDEVLKSAVDRISYATWLWCEGEKDNAIKQMTEFRKLGVASEVGTIIESRMLVDVNKVESAMQLLDSVAFTDAGLLEYSELKLMSLGLKIGKHDRARKALEKLYAMPLDNATQMRVSDVMDQLGMKEMSEAIVQRVRRSGASDIPTMVALMLKLKRSEEQGDKAAAIELAWKIYQRTVPNSQSSMSSRTAAGQSADVRSATVRLLVESGESERLVKSLEESLARTPKNAALVHQLAELYRETGKAAQADEMLKPYVRSSGGTFAAPTPLTEEELIAQDAKARVVLLDNVLSNGDVAGIERLKNELFLSVSDKRQLSTNAKVASMLLGTDSLERRQPKGKLQAWLTRVTASEDGEEKLKQLVKKLEPSETTELTVPQMVALVCYAEAAEDKETALRIAKTIVSHRNAAYSVAALASPGRETTWAIVPVAIKFGDADLAVKLAQIALKPASDVSSEALQLKLELALLQIELGKLTESEQSLREIIAKLNGPNEKELQARSELAMRIAILAAERSLIDVSCEAALRASYLASSGSGKMNENLFKLVKTWQEKQASPDLIYNTIKEVIFRKHDPNRWRLYPEPRRSYGGSHDFTFPEPEPKPLALLLVDLAKANNSLPSLMQDLDTFTSQPALQNVMNAMKAYAQRALGNAAEATKLFEVVMESPKTIPDEMLLLYALTSPVPGGDEATKLPPEVCGPLLKKFMDGRIMHTGTRMAMLSQIKACIAAGDHVMLDSFVVAVADAIPKVPNYEEESLALMLSQFYRYLVGECKEQGKSQLAAKYLERAEAKK